MLQALLTDVPGLWSASSTTARDRKRLLRTLIADVTLLPEPGPDKLAIGIRWHTGAIDEVITELPLPPGPAKRTPYAVAVVLQFDPNAALARVNIARAAGNGCNTRVPVRNTVISCRPGSASAKGLPWPVRRPAGGEFGDELVGGADGAETDDHLGWSTATPNAPSSRCAGAAGP